MTPFKVILVFLAVCSMISLIKCAGNESIVPTCECIFLVPLIIFGKRVTYDNCAKYRDYKTCLQADVNCNVDKAKTNNPDLEKECDELAPQPPNPSQSGQPIVTQVPTQHPTLAVTNTSTEHCGKKCEPPVNVTDGKLDMPELMPAGKKKKEKKAHEKSCTEYRNKLKCLGKKDDNGEEDDVCGELLQTAIDEYEGTCGKLETSTKSGAMTSGIGPLFLLVANIWIALHTKML